MMNYFDKYDGNERRFIAYAHLSHIYKGLDRTRAFTLA